MSLSRRLGAILAAAAVVLSAAPVAAADAALNKEGFWTVGRDDADAQGCLASIFGKGDAILIVQVAPGHVDFVVGGEKRMRRGKTGVMMIDADRFEFEPLYTDGGKLFFFEDPNGRALAALRQARSVTVQVDGRQFLDASVENTGVAGALDAAADCSNGKSGWWGPGVSAKPVADGPAADKLSKEVVYNKEDIWAIAVGAEPGVCVAQAEVDGPRRLQILAANGRMGLAVGGKALPRGRKGKVETDAYAFDFKPLYDRDGAYMSSEAPFDSQAIFALARAKWVRVTADGRELVDVSLEDSGFAELLDSVAACSRGEKGWWGEGAPAAS